ncbi:hypothetical protein ACRRTK_006032 [Alexandromys fortis]
MAAMDSSLVTAGFYDQEIQRERELKAGGSEWKEKGKRESRRRHREGQRREGEREKRGRRGYTEYDRETDQDLKFLYGFMEDRIQSLDLLHTECSELALVPPSSVMSSKPRAAAWVSPFQRFTALCLFVGSEMSAAEPAEAFVGMLRTTDRLQESDLGRNQQQASVKKTYAACPRNWIGVQNKCFYFSEDSSTWTLSQKFCLEQKAQLARFDNMEELASHPRSGRLCLPEQQRDQQCQDLCRQEMDL